MIKDSTIRALHLLNPHQLALKHIPFNHSSEDLLIKVLAATICGSDLKIFRGEMEGITYPLIPGHEWVGEVIDAPSTHKNLIGKRIVPDILYSCHLCSFCKKDLPNLCNHLVEPGLTLPGGFSEITSLKCSNAYVVPDHISDLEASLFEPLAVALYALERVKISNEDVVLIIGGGGIGQLIGQCAHLYNPKHLMLLDRHPFRTKMASDLCADKTFSTEDEVSRFLINHPHLSPTKIFEVTGSTSGVKLALSVAQKNAEIAIVGYSGNKEIPIKSSEIMVKHLTIKGILSPTNTLPTALELVKQRKVNLKPLVTHTFKLEEASEAFNTALYNKHATLRVAIRN